MPKSALPHLDRHDPVATFGLIAWIAVQRRSLGSRGARWCQKRGIGPFRAAMEQPSLPRNLHFTSPVGLVAAGDILNTWDIALSTHCTICGGCPLSKVRRISEN